MELVAAERKQVDILLFYVDFHIPHSLYRVGVKQHAVPLADGSDRGNGLNGADLIVGVHNGDKSRSIRDGGLYFFRTDNAVSVYVQIGDGKALFFQCGTGVQHRVMLEGGGDNVIFALASKGSGRTLNGPVVAFTAAAGKIDLSLVGPQALSCCGSGFLQSSLCLLPQPVKAGGVSVSLPVKGEHRFQNLRRNSGGGGVIRINRFPHRNDHVPFLIFRQPAQL